MTTEFGCQESGRIEKKAVRSAAQDIEAVGDLNLKLTRTLRIRDVAASQGAAVALLTSFSSAGSPSVSGAYRIM